jgi:hypothetical protein
LIHNPDNEKPYDILYALISVDARGNEGICAINTPIGPQVAITGEKRVLDIFIKSVSTPSSRAEAKSAGKRIVVAEFSRKSTTDLEAN